MIDINVVKNLFELFSGQNPEENMPFILLAENETKKITESDLSDDDSRVNFLCAAIANYRYQQARAAAEASYTYAGESVSAGKCIALSFAESMLKDYYQLCRDIIKPKNFVFMGFSGEGDLND